MNTSPAQPTRFGSYTLDRKLAEGGMAEVFLARQAGLGGFEKVVVVKRILPSLSTHTDFIEMFLNEARLAARLSHSNVVQVIEAGEIDGQYYIAMEYIDGTDLKTFYEDAERTGQPLVPGIACRIIADLLSGLHYAHTLTDDHGRPLGVVHRDVSPQNVLITKTGTVKIVDFGIAKATRSAAQQTRAGQVKGKIAYLSPEQAMGRPLDARSDVFACGILLWELTTGQRLYARSHDMASIMAITEEELPLARSVRAELPEELDHLLAQALTKSPLDRYPSAQAMQADLEQLIRQQGWAGDRRTLERYMQARFTVPTPASGQPVLSETSPPPPAMSSGRSPRPGQRTPSAAIAVPPASGQGSAHPAPEESAFSDGPTMLAGPTDSPLHGAPGVTAPASSMANAATVALSMPGARPPASLAPPPAPPPPAAPPPASPPYPTPGHARTPSGMRAMPPMHHARAPLPPRYADGYHDGVTESRTGTGRRVLVVVTAAVLVTGAAIVALEWRPNQPTVASLSGPAPTAQARVAIEVSEPATIEIDGRRLRVDTTAEIPLPAGKQLTVLATSLRSSDTQSTRSITLPPVADGERIPLKIEFAK